jgi:hypothetical protein
MAKVTAPTGLDMRKYGRNLARAMNQKGNLSAPSKKTAPQPYKTEDKTPDVKANKIPGRPVPAKVANISPDDTAEGVRMGGKGIKTRGTGAATRGTRSMGPLA